ncbi:MAG: glycoside hydrolase family 3 N-terminal domain-containing protein [Cyanobacteriota bacterium]|nr:glycoside hydrolase family 3 N-terminal domain-containing protein [Cyanobacteriota bacterium]
MAMVDSGARRLAAELLVIRASGTLSDDQRRHPRWELPNQELRRLLSEGVGGVILLGGSAAELSLRTRELQAWAHQPLLLCADVEEGVGQRFEGASWLAPPLSLGRLHGREPQRAEQLAERYGRCIGREARAVGLNWVLAPVADVNNNPANPVINVRAWGEDPATVSTLATAFLRGATAEGVLCCAKHFPGHGDTQQDSHLELPLLEHDRPRLDSIELPPFDALIKAGVPAVMTAHLLLPALDRERPATLSAPLLTELLRLELGFTGLVVTDALVMEGIAAHWTAGEAAVLALEAGADLVLMPADAEAAIKAICAALQSGRLKRERLEASRQRRRRALAQLRDDTLQRDAANPLGWLSNGPLPDDRSLAVELIQTGLERQGPSRPLAGVQLLLRVDGGPGAAVLPPTAPALLRAATGGWPLTVLDGVGPSLWSGNPAEPLALERLGPEPLLLLLFLRGNPFRGSMSSTEPWAAVIEQLQRADRLVALGVLGSPYLWDQLRKLLHPGVAAVYSPAQTPLAQQQVLEALEGRPAAQSSTHATAAHAFTD